MDHKLIDQALAELFATPNDGRSPEMIQGWARFICAAAGVEIESTSPTQRDHVELHAAVAILAAELRATSHHTYLTFRHDCTPRLASYIFISDEVTLMGLGRTGEEVLQKIRLDAALFGKKEAA
jgi:hypothetical protein